jgi:hypothetical protein
VKGQSTNLFLRAACPPNVGISFQAAFNPAQFNFSSPQFYLAPALQNSGLMRTSSDLPHVKVTRHNSATGDNWQKIFDCSGATPYPSLWLENGDDIEVPDKP